MLGNLEVHIIIVILMCNRTQYLLVSPAAYTTFYFGALTNDEILDADVRTSRILREAQPHTHYFFLAGREAALLRHLHRILRS